MLDLASFQKGLDSFVEEDVPYDWKRQQIDVLCFLYDALVDEDTGNPIAGRDPSTRRENVPGGFSRGNWRVDISPRSYVIGDRANPPSPMTDDEIRDKLGGIKQGLKSRQQSFDMVWIYNNARYIQALEDGHSRQRPNGFVQLAIEETRLFIAARIDAYERRK